MGERAGTALPKQFVTLADRPLIAWSFDVLRDGGCAPIVVVAPEEHIDRTREALATYDDVVITAGGASRQESVRAGLDKIDADIVVIHDAARPFASSAAVARTVAALADADGAIVAVPVEDTIKQVDGDRVVSTPDRSRLWRSQTPQAFKTEVLRTAHAQALADGVIATDDAELVERVGGSVTVVPGSTRNIKITSVADLELARSLATEGKSR